MNIVFIALFAALIGVSGLVAVPVGPLGVPIVFQNMMVVLTGLLLGPLRGGAAVLLWILAGALGLPVFSAGRGGFAYLMGPTGGFFPGYVLAAVVAGFLLGTAADRRVVTPSARRGAWIRAALAALAGFVVLYPTGIAWFMHAAKLELRPALVACCLPFLPGDLVKLALTVPLVLRLRPRVVARMADEGRRA